MNIKLQQRQECLDLLKKEYQNHRLTQTENYERKNEIRLFVCKSSNSNFRNSDSFKELRKTDYVIQKQIRK